MAESVARRAVAAVACIFGGVLVAWTLSGGPPDAIGRRAGLVRAAHAAPATAVATRDPRPGPGWAANHAGNALGRLSLLAVLAAGLMLARLRSRARREIARFWLLPSRVDEAPADAVAALLKAWHEQLREPWWRRLALGQPALTFEAHATAGSSGPQVRLLLGGPPALAAALAGPLNACYPDARLIPQPAPAVQGRALLRLRKRDRFTRRVAAAPQEGPPAMDALLATLAAVGGGDTVVQFTLTPAPTALERLARLLLRERERQLARIRGRSHVGDLELAGGATTSWTALWVTALHITAPSWSACRQIAGALAGASAENRLIERRVLALRTLHRTRMARGLGSPLPNPFVDAWSSSELAALFHLPSPGLRSVGFERSSVPRAIAPPQVLRPIHRTSALGRDDVGYVGLHPGDLEKNLALIGQIGSGKTSVLVKTTERDAHDPDCCVIVIDPNSSGVSAHLSAMPEQRTVHVLDVAHPECGFNPLLASGEVSKVADDVVEAFIDVHDTGEIMTSSRQFLGGAAEAVIGAYRHGALDHPPSLWDLYRVLLPDQKAFRARLLDAIGSDRELLGAATLLGEDIPQGLRDIGAQYALRMSAPRNKLFRMRSRNVDRVLRHPRQLNVRELIANREVLVVDGRMGSTGVEQTRVLVMFLLSLVFAELRRQLELPPAERVRVCVKLDEAHLVMGEHFAASLATLRAAGLEVTACYQYSAQLTEPVVRAGAGSLLASRCVFQLSEPEDAEQAAKLAMSAYASAIRPDPESRARVGITPDVLMHLPRHWAICSWQANGARVPAFAMNTLPLAVDEARIAHHAARQRERGGFVPELLPHPLEPAGDGPTRDPLPEPETIEPAGDTDLSPEAEERAALEQLMRANGTPVPAARPEPPRTAQPEHAPRPPAQPVTAAAPASPSPSERAQLERAQAAVLEHARAEAAAATASATATTAAPAQPDAATTADPARRPRPPRPRRSSAPAAPPAARSAAPVPDSYLEVQLEPTSLTWDDTPVDPADKAPTPDHRQLQCLSALHKLGPLLSSQLEREFYAHVGERTVQRALTAMRRAGWVRRFRLREPQGRGQPKYVYVLDRRGFDLARDVPGPRGPYIPRDARFAERRFDSVLKPLHDLHANALLLALVRQMPHAARGWRGPGESVISPPRRRPRGEPERPVRADEIELESPLRSSGLQLERFEQIKPDFTIEVAITGTDRRRRRFDLLVELDRSGNPRSDSNQRKLLRYDALLSGWHVMVERYRTLGHSPIVVVACADEPTARRWATAADELLTGRVARLGDPDTEAAFHARRRIFFATELDLHRGRLRGLRVPRHPPDLRRRVEGRNAARHPAVELVTFLPDRYLR